MDEGRRLHGKLHDFIGTREMVSREQILAALSSAIDQERERGISNLNLIKHLAIENGKVQIMTAISTPFCSAEGGLLQRMREAVETLSEVEEVIVELTWDEQSS